MDNGQHYKIIIDPLVNDRMVEHFEFLANVSEVAAINFFDRLEKDVASLSYMPYRNPVYEWHPSHRCMISNKRYRIIYRIADGTVFVDDVQDCRQSESRNLI